MKNPIIILMLSFLLGACSSNSEEVEPIEIESTSPEAPILISPEDNLFCTTSELHFNWMSSIDTDGGDITYIFEISNSGDFDSLYFTTNLSSPSLNTQVSKGQNFYWRVMARDDSGNSSDYSAVRHFYTEGAPSSNFLPSVPQLINPEQDMITGQEVTLAWEATDADNHALSYDLFFGTTETPALYKESLIGQTYEINNLNAGTTYYWKIIVKDENGGKTIGQTWSFKTS